MSLNYKKKLYLKNVNTFQKTEYLYFKFIPHIDNYDL